MAKSALTPKEQKELEKLQGYQLLRVIRWDKTTEHKFKK